MYDEKHIVLKSIPAYTVNFAADKTRKIRKAISNHKDGVATAMILGVTAGIVAVSMKSLSDKVNS